MTDTLIIVIVLLSIIFGALTLVLYRLWWRLNTTDTQAAARERAEKYRVATLINTITDAIISMDSHGIISTYNAAALDLIDTNEAIDGKHVGEVLSLEDADGVSIDVFKELTKSISIRLRDDIIMPIDGNDKLRLEVTFAPVQGGDTITPSGYVLILRDITKAKNLEEERDEFISVVSHELRTPITIAEGSLSNAQLLIERNLKEKIPEAVEEAHRQVIFLAKMVNDLSTLSRAERGVGGDTELIDVAELAVQLHSEYEPQARQKGLAFNIDTCGKLGSVDASRLYLQELLQNLITNAIKYTPKGSVTLSIKKDTKGIIHFKVKDTGIGISKTDIAKIFDRFYRAEDYRTRETSGTGLGLYVSMKLAKKLGCKIEVDSRLNHGSTFSFSLKSAK